MKSILHLLANLLKTALRLAFWGTKKVLVPVLITRWVLNNPKKVLSVVEKAKKAWKKV